MHQQFNIQCGHDKDEILINEINDLWIIGYLTKPCPASLRILYTINPKNFVKRYIF